MSINPHHISNTERVSSSVPAGVLFTVAHDQPTPVMSLYPIPEKDKLTALQSAVCGNIEHLYIGPSRHRQFVTYDGWVNEDGMANELHVGLQVRCLVGGKYVLTPVFGSLLITAGESLSGETSPLTPEEMRDIVLFTMHDGLLPIVSINPEHRDA